MNALCFSALCSPSKNQMTPSDLDPAGGTMSAERALPQLPLPPAQSCSLFFTIVLSSAPALPVIGGVNQACGGDCGSYREAGID